MLVVFAVIAVMVQVGCATAETYASASMKQELLHPKGFDMIWSCGGRSGWSRVFFQEDNEKIVADIAVVDIEDVDINKPENFGPERCTTEAKLTDNGVIFHGCSSAGRDVSLAYDPGNKLTPFKGSGPDCPRIELNPR